MTKKILLGLGAVLFVAAGVAAMSAYEAHVINVTAHIENALTTHGSPIEFGTVFPQEYLESQFTVRLSDSFGLAEGYDDVEYYVRQKPKPIWPVPVDCELYLKRPTIDQARAHCHDYPGDLKCCYRSLCPFLSKLPELEEGDKGVPSYYDLGPPAKCITPSPDYGMGRLAKSVSDYSDVWTVDLKVPPVEGYVGQDWPAGCPTVAENDKDYGCDLWIEVYNISHFQCDDGIDNDQDTYIDYPADQGCTSLNDNDESGPY
ncbi:MAG: hypothetical protein ACE5J0_02740 [Candidatus Paceibacterales bacterium]